MQYSCAVTGLVRYTVGSLCEYFGRVGDSNGLDSVRSAVARPVRVRRRPARSRHGSLSNPGTHHMSLTGQWPVARITGVGNPVILASSNPVILPKSKP